jgi:hypothetical protein
VECQSFLLERAENLAKEPEQAQSRAQAEARAQAETRAQAEAGEIKMSYTDKTNHFFKKHVYDHLDDFAFSPITSLFSEANWNWEHDGKIDLIQIGTNLQTL